MLELTDKDIKTVTVAVLHMLKKLKENLNMLNRDKKYF